MIISKQNKQMYYEWRWQKWDAMALPLLCQYIWKKHFPWGCGCVPLQISEQFCCFFHDGWDCDLGWRGCCKSSIKVKNCGAEAAPLGSAGSETEAWRSQRSALYTGCHGAGKTMWSPHSVPSLFFPSPFAISHSPSQHQKCVSVCGWLELCYDFHF